MRPELRAAIEALIERAERFAHLDDDEMIIVQVADLRRLAAAYEAEPSCDGTP